MGEILILLFGVALWQCCRENEHYFSVYYRRRLGTHHDGGGGERAAGSAWHGDVRNRPKQLRGKKSCAGRLGQVVNIESDGADSARLDVDRFSA